MAWVAPITFVDDVPLTAAQMNAMLRDNMLETAPAKAYTPGGYFVTTSANQIAERVGQRVTDTSPGTVTSTSYDNPETGTPGPTVTATTGVRALVIFGAELWKQTEGASGVATVRASIEVSGNSENPPSDSRSLCNATPGQGRFQASHAIWYDDLTPGTNTFTMKFRVSSAAANVDSRRIIVLPY